MNIVPVLIESMQKNHECSAYANHKRTQHQITSIWTTNVKEHFSAEYVRGNCCREDTTPWYWTWTRWCPLCSSAAKGARSGRIQACVQKVRTKKPRRVAVDSCTIVEISVAEASKLQQENTRSTFSLLLFSLMGRHCWLHHLAAFPQQFCVLRVTHTVHLSHV